MFGVSAALGSKFGPYNLNAGQIWEYREYEDTEWCDVSSCESYDDYLSSVENACKILKIEAESGFMGRAVLVRFLKNESCSTDIGEELWFAAENFGTFFRLLYDPTVETRYGIYCGMCGKYNEYAIFNPGFMCWACRNGWTT
jgi:hypothetical protein